MKRPEDSASNPGPADAEAPRPGAFTTTHWSQVMRAGQDDPAAAGAAMGQLYQVYRLPIYNFICRQYHCNHQDAEDLTQGFFEHLIKKATVKRADRDIGKFRSFLLGALNHFRANERDRILTEKRGGKCQMISLDDTGAPEMRGQEPPVPLTADKEFNRIGLSHSSSRRANNSKTNTPGKIRRVSLRRWNPPFSARIPKTCTRSGPPL